MSHKINKRILILESKETYLYIVESLKDQFDDIYIVSDYMKPVSELEPELVSQLPAVTYCKDVTPDSPKALKVKSIDKVNHVKLKDMDLGKDNAFFVVGKKSWYFLRDMQSGHVGLRNTNLDWQIVHLAPFSMGGNKFVFCHTMTDEHYKRHMDYFFNDEALTKTVVPLDNYKIIIDFEGIQRAFNWAIEQPFGTRLGLDYETNGLWRGDKYEDVEAVGVGISSKEVGFYIDFRFLTTEQLNQVKVKYREFLDKHATNCWVFNIDFEMLITRKFLGDWAIYDFKDADIWRIVYGDQIGYSKKIVEDRRARGNSPKFKEILVNRDQRWSLKYTAQKFLNVESWDNEFEWLESKFWVIFNGFQHDNVQDFLQNPIVGNLFHKWVEDGIFTDLDMTRILKSLSVYKKMTTMSAVREVFKGHEELADELKIVMFGCKNIKQVKSHPYYKEVIERYPETIGEFDLLLENPKYFGNPFSIQPASILGTYCIIDSYYTLMIAERHYEEDKFNHDPSDPDKVPAKWMTTQKMIDIFNGNKAIGAKLSMYGLYKSNTRRDRYNKIQIRARVHSNYVVALAYYQMLLSSQDLEKHKDESLLHPIFKTVIEHNGNPMDFGRATKVIFPLLYNPNCDKGWDEEKAELYLGDLAEEIKEVLLSHKPGGFVNASAHSRALNLHKETAAIIEEAWIDQDLPDGFNWMEIKKYYTDLGKLNKSRAILDRLNTCNIKGKHINEVLDMENFEIDGVSYTFKEAILILKKQFYDLNSNNEMVLGAMSERWKDYKTLLFLYHPAEYKDIIDGLGLWKAGDSIATKISTFLEYMNGVISVYKKIVFDDWTIARQYARENDYPEDLQNPNEEDMNDHLQANAYLDKMLSHDLMIKHKVSLGLMNQYVWYRTLDKEDIMKRKAWLMDVKHASPISYKNWMQEVGMLGKLHDNLDLGDINSMRTTHNFAIADFDVNAEDAYVKMATLFRLNRKYYKLDQYLEGQLCKSDDRLLGVEEDGVPQLARLPLADKVSSAAGDNVKMYPQYEIMQKSTKRNSSGVHTIPSRNQTKGVIEAPEDSLLVYTDISGMELRGIAAISRDPVMIRYFEEGKDIYTEAAYAYHVGYHKKDWDKMTVRKLFRNAYKLGVISSIYTASDPTLAVSFEVEVHEVREIRNAIFKQFQTLYDWQQAQIAWNKANRNRIRTFLGDIRKTYEEAAKQTRQAVNLDVQGTCSLIATAGFNNIISSALKKRMRLTPAVIVHDALIAYAKASDVELLYEHYQENFYKYLDDQYQFRFPFDLELATTYYDKVVLSKDKEGRPRHYNIAGTNISAYQVLSRCIAQGKKIEFLDESITIDVVKERIDNKYDIYEQYTKTAGNAAYDRDFSFGSYDIRFVD